MQTLFLKLEQILLDHEKLWRFEPFHQSFDSELPWVNEYPKLSSWISKLSIEQVRYYKSSPSCFFTDVVDAFPAAKQIQNLVLLPSIECQNLPLSRDLESGIPGRKLEQILSMGSFALNHHKGIQWLEWCSGKGYLGRFLAANSKQSVTSFEWQSSLCEKGQQEADDQLLPMTFVQGDALSENAKQVVKQDMHAVALHACGDLHVRLIQHASEMESKAISVSPCCYHLIESDRYQALSELGLQSTLNLTKTELRIPLQETVTGGKRVSKHREDEMSFRLGFDLLLKQYLGIQHYIAIPSIKKSMLSLGFENFCYWAAKQKNIELPVLDFAYWEALGKQRFWHMERLSLAQQLFRRTIEMWLVYDRAMYLQEKEYQVMVAEFCERSVTPRNIIIHATKK